MKQDGPKVLLLDIETAPMLASIWQLWEQTIAPDQLERDWHILSWAAKWLDDPPSKVMYMDQRKAKRMEDDTRILKGMWDLLNEADVIITQNGKFFDERKLNARFIIQGLQPPSPYQHVDTKQIAARKFGFTSNSLDYLSKIFRCKYKKLKHKKFPGRELWNECLKRNLEAWNEMEKYNKHDVLGLEEVYKKMAPWVKTYDPNLYSESLKFSCTCGSSKFKKDGFNYTASGRYQTYKCLSCGKKCSDRTNLLNKEKKDSLKRWL